MGGGSVPVKEGLVLALALEPVASVRGSGASDPVGRPNWTSRQAGTAV